MVDVSNAVMGTLNSKMRSLVRFLEKNHVNVTEYREGKIGGGYFIDKFWVPLIEIGDDVKIRVYGSFFEIWTITEDGWSPTIIVDSFQMVYDLVIHL